MIEENGSSTTYPEQGRGSPGPRDPSSQCDGRQLWKEDESEVVLVVVE